MSVKDWKRVADAPTTIDRRADVDGCDIVFRIDLRLSDRGDAAVRLRDMRRDALALAGGDAQGVWELQWCDGSARISISRSGTFATMPEWHERQLADRVAAGERATVPADYAARRAAGEGGHGMAEPCDECGGRRVIACRANRDGDCSWNGCPQTRDGEPKKSGRHCPRDAWAGRDEDEDVRLPPCPKCAAPEAAK